jgi:hypothetical protein
MKLSFKNNFSLLFFGIFAFVATIFGIVAVVVWRYHEQTIRQGVRTEGRVVSLNRNNKGSAAPVIEFETEQGETQTYYSSTYSSPPAYDRGEVVTLWYNPEAPDDVVLAGLDRWLLPAIFGGFFLVFGGIGYGGLFYQYLKGRRRQWLVANGRPIQAALLDVGIKHNIRMGTKHPFTIRAQWHDPASNKVYTYESDFLWYDPSAFVINRPIEVLIDPKNPASYHMDLSFLPEAGN